MTTVVIAKIPGSVHGQFMMSGFPKYVPVVTRTQICYFHLSLLLKKFPAEKKIVISYFFQDFENNL